VHAEGLVDDVQAVDVQIQYAMRGRLAGRGEHRFGLALERMTGHETGADVVLRLDDDGDFLRQKLGDARLMRIEIAGARRIEERHHAHHALGRMAHRTGQYLVGSGHVARDFGDVIDHDGALLQLHPSHQMLLRALQRLGRHGVAAAGHRQCDILVRHPERDERATHVLDRGLQDQVEFVRLSRGGIGGRHLQHERQVALAHVEIPFAQSELRAQQ
jgi:hypothetical protein